MNRGPQKYVGTIKVTYCDQVTKVVHYHSNTETVTTFTERVRQLTDVTEVQVLVDLDQLTK